MAYLRQHTWLEYGPDAIALRMPPQLATIARRVAAGLSGNYDNCTWWPPAFAGDTPSCWNVALGQPVAIPGVPDYTKAQYGTIPDPHDLPSPPTAAVPVVQNQPAVAVPSNAGAYQQWAQDSRDYLQQQQDSGAWNPAGNLPFNAIDLGNFWDRYGTYLTLAGLGVAGFVAFKVLVKR